MSLPHERLLLSIFDASPAAGWMALCHRSPSWKASFRTPRFAKVLPNGELQFTIGATALGESAGLNHTIRKLILDAGIPLIERQTTAGNKRGSGEYPAIRLSEIDERDLEILVHRIEGAVTHVAASSA